MFEEPLDEDGVRDGELLEDDRLSGVSFGEAAELLEPPEPEARGPASATPTGEAWVGHEKAWERRTVEGLNHARALAKHALQSLDDSHAVHGHTKRQLHANTHLVNNTIRKKIGLTEDMVKALDDRVESVEDTMRQLGECLFQLQRALRSKWAPLSVCERRLQLRDTRPPQELVRDLCQEAMERERQALIEARQELQDHVDSSKEMLIRLDRVRSELLEDMQHKRHALRVDRACLSPRKPISTSGRDRLVLPQLQEVVHYGLPPAPKDAAVGTGHEHEEQRQLTAKELIAKAVRCEEDAVRLANESDAVMVHTKRECGRASQQVMQELLRRAEATCALRRQLEDQMHELEQTIAQAELSQARTKKKLESHDKPLRALDKQFAHRSTRTDREEIRDPVHDEMEGHLDTVKRNVRSLTDKWQATAEILEQLRASKQRLQEDYRCKCLSQKIDDVCIKVTPKKAIELDRMDPRGGRCREPSARRRRDYGREDF